MTAYPLNSTILQPKITGFQSSRLDKVDFFSGNYKGFNLIEYGSSAVFEIYSIIKGEYSLWKSANQNTKKIALNNS